LFLLSSAIILLKNYDIDKRYKSYVELGYYIILKYSLITRDYKPIYDFSINFGFYPIAKALTDNKLIFIDTILNNSIQYLIESQYGYSGLTETYAQHDVRNFILNSERTEISLVAPTSYGKSSLIIEDIKNNLLKRNFVAIIVPSKSLLTQTYRALKNANLNQKIIIHDEMYENESRFISVLTQERALRLLNKNPELFFDSLYIDEAHNLFNKDSRTILLSRLIKLNKKRNVDQKLIYLSPLIADSDNLKFEKEQDIVEQRIEFNMKEPELYELGLDSDIRKYNRFLDTFYSIGKEVNYFKYILNNSTEKTFIYLYSPKKIEMFADELFNEISENSIELDSELKITIENLKKYVHDDFYEIEYLKRGIIYLHGKLPDNIKEYLEYKFSNLKSVKYLIANRVVLEGMNLPVDSLFILNTYNLHTKDLTNLIGRVNRLNQIFNSENINLESLIPKIYFVNNEKYNRSHSNMSKKISSLRVGAFVDELDNPLLLKFDFNKFNTDKEQDRKTLDKCNEIIKNEKFVLNEQTDGISKLAKKMLELGMNSLYKVNDILCKELYARIIRKSERSRIYIDEDIIELIREIFIAGLDEYIIDDEFRRLEIDEAVSYYKNFITISKSKSLKENISNMVSYFKKRQKSANSKFYIGGSFGEIPYERENGYGECVYVDLKAKDYKQLVNLAIIKLKIENDFVNYKLIMFFQILLDYEIISQEKYNSVVYGTNDKSKLNLLKMGLTINVINRLDADKQIEHIMVDENNIIHGNSEFQKYYKEIDDFFRFELDKFLC